MKSPIILLLVLLSFTLSCSRASEAPQNTTAQSAPVAQSDAEAKEVAKTTARSGFQAENVSLKDDARFDSSAPAVERKIIRNADITIEVDSTSEAQHRVTSIAEARGGFVVTSERNNARVPIRRKGSPTSS